MLEIINRILIHHDTKSKSKFIKANVYMYIYYFLKMELRMK